MGAKNGGNGNEMRREGKKIERGDFEERWEWEDGS